MGEYTVIAMSSVAFVLLLERLVLCTGLLRTRAYLIAMLIVVVFQALMDGWLTKLSRPVVIYNTLYTSDVRFPFDIPIEDWLFGFSLVTLALLLWRKAEN